VLSNLIFFGVSAAAIFADNGDDDDGIGDICCFTIVSFSFFGKGFIGLLGNAFFFVLISIFFFSFGLIIIFGFESIANSLFFFFFGVILNELVFRWCGFETIASFRFSFSFLTVFDFISILFAIFSSFFSEFLFSYSSLFSFVNTVNVGINSSDSFVVFWVDGGLYFLICCLSIFGRKLGLFGFVGIEFFRSNFILFRCSLSSFCCLSAIFISDIAANGSFACFNFGSLSDTISDFITLSLFFFVSFLISFDTISTFLSSVFCIFTSFNFIFFWFVSCTLFSVEFNERISVLLLYSNTRQYPLSFTSLFVETAEIWFFNIANILFPNFLPAHSVTFHPFVTPKSFNASPNSFFVNLSIINPLFPSHGLAEKNFVNSWNNLISLLVSLTFDNNSQDFGAS